MIGFKRCAGIVINFAEPAIRQIAPGFSARIRPVDLLDATKWMIFKRGRL